MHGRRSWSHAHSRTIQGAFVLPAVAAQAIFQSYQSGVLGCGSRAGHSGWPFVLLSLCSGAWTVSGLVLHACIAADGEVGGAEHHGVHEL